MDRLLQSYTPSTHPNAPWNFWKPQSQFSESEWMASALQALCMFKGLPVATYTDVLEAIDAILFERQFGDDHFTLSWDKRLYYRAIRRFLPTGMRQMLHRIAGSPKRREQFPLRWPFENRYPDFQLATVAGVMSANGISQLSFTHFWPKAKRYALMLTHDVEGPAGQVFALRIADLEERHGLRSSFNFVPDAYPLDRSVIDELRARGFEIGVHGLNHDGQLFRSYSEFSRSAKKINEYLKEWNAVGFRSPFTHRNPDWMQELDIEYDCTFFDTDPFETMSGGTMSLWPFQMGRFIELPFTMAQDSTLLYSLKQNTPNIWLEKLATIRKYCGMAHVPTHPDYLCNPVAMGMYEQFLREITKHDDYWNALPKDMARWWKERQSISGHANGNGNSRLDAATGMIRIGDNGPEIVLTENVAHTNHGAVIDVL